MVSDVAIEETSSDNDAITAMTEEHRAAFEVHHTATRVKYLQLHGGFLVLSGSLRLCRVALGVETAAGAADAPQLLAFGFLLLSALVALVISKCQASPATIYQACGSLIFCVDVAFQVIMYDLLHHENQQPPEVYFFIGATAMAINVLSPCLTLSLRVSIVITTLNLPAFATYLSFDVFLVWMVMSFLLTWTFHWLCSQHQQTWMLQRRAEGRVLTVMLCSV